MKDEQPVPGLEARQGQCPEGILCASEGILRYWGGTLGVDPVQSSCSQMDERMDEAPGPDVGLKTQCRQAGQAIARVLKYKRYGRGFGLISFLPI